MKHLYSELAIRRVLERECEKVGGQKAWADAVGVSQQYVCDVLQGRRKPGEAICEALGYRRHEVYAPEPLDILLSDKVREHETERA